MKLVRMPTLGVPSCYCLTDDDDESKVYGTILITHFGKAIAVIWFIWVKPTHRRKGCASAMVRALQKEFKIIRTQYDVTPKGSKLMLKKCGFERDGNELIWRQVTQ